MIHICPSHQDAFLNIFQHLYKAWFVWFLTITISIVYLDIKLRAQVVGMRKAGLSVWAIAAHSNLPLSTTGRPTKMNERDFRELSRIITCHCCLTFAQVTNTLTTQVSTRTVQQEIHQLGKQSRISPKKPYLRPQDFQRQLAFTHEHRHWRITDWARVIWTNKLSFELGKKSYWVCVWRTASKKFNLENLAVNHRSVMVWGAFMWRHKRPPCDSPRPTNCHQPALWPFVEHMEWAPYVLGCQQLTLMRDGAPIHTSRVSQDWHERNGLVKLQWPPHSPDMNPIENLWKKIELQVSTFYQPQPMDELQAAITAAWNDIPSQHLDQLFKTMPKRRQEIIDRHGGPINY
ncbi:hypothetical protein O181_088912 [Austropuccinia psidii MF-1]|uniref:Tc1-like transposase DDE domain-containing protein n=1 Tax=Austropuccinia psidii MF-1 TaxID=1389203 RepID=A0A9Q3ISK6_9BASI|nr:hypothetical protein [Austropuccinia psidii MF-1]